MYCFKTLPLIIVLTCLLPPSMASGQERKIKPGDAIEIVVYEHEELSETVVVSPEGTVDSPFLTGIPVDGMTLRRFDEILVSQLARYLERSPLVKVRFTESYPIQVTVLGQVQRPGMHLLPNTSTIQGAIGEAGGVTAGAQLSQVKLIRTEQTSANGHIENQVVNLEKFYLEGDPTYLPMLKDGDTIVVPGYPLAAGVKVIGSVNKPGSYEVFFRTSVLDVISLAGGPTDDANLGSVKVITHTGQNAREARFNVKDLSKLENSETIPLVEPGDIVYVPKKGFTWKTFVRAMRDVATFSTLFLIIRYGRKY